MTDFFPYHDFNIYTSSESPCKLYTRKQELTTEKGNDIKCRKTKNLGH